jgi:hypothetical protein
MVDKEMVFGTLAGKICAEVKDQFVIVKLPDVKIDKMIRNKPITIDGKDFIYTYLF